MAVVDMQVLGSSTRLANATLRGGEFFRPHSVPARAAVVPSTEAVSHRLHNAAVDRTLELWRVLSLTSRADLRRKITDHLPPLVVHRAEVPSDRRPAAALLCAFLGTPHATLAFDPQVRAAANFSANLPGIHRLTPFSSSSTTASAVTGTPRKSNRMADSTSSITESTSSSGTISTSSS